MWIKVLLDAKDSSRDAGTQLGRALGPWLRVNGALTSLDVRGNYLGAAGWCARIFSVVAVVVPATFVSTTTDTRLLWSF